uniref:E3 UFM1-protein ligase 1 homolog n=2 Tax=Plectus sambesii TaxID=2011161 RepID=A0A914XKY3_9BILA
MTTWADIQKLASDLQRVQLGQVSRKLADRNCIEVVAKLIDLHLIDIVFTVDGKEYVTKQHLTTQIKNECLGNGGRVALSDLAQILNMEYQHIEDRANEIVKSDQGFLLCVGQLIAREYLNNVCTEINDRLKEEGRTTLAQITKAYDLPSDLLKAEVYAALGVRIEGIADKDDPSIIYTSDYIDAQKALVRGALSAITKVTPVQKVVTDLGMPVNLFFRSVDELISAGQLRGQITGGRNIDRAVYVPEIYNELLRVYVLGYFQQNGYLELTTLKKLGISDSTAYLKELLGKEKYGGLVFLSTVALGADSWTESVDAVTAAIERDGWADISAHLPPAASDPNDSRLAAERMSKLSADWQLCSDAYIFTNVLVTQCAKALEPTLNEKAREEAPNVAKVLKEMQNKKDEVVAAPKKAAKKGGGGKKGKKTKDDDDWAETPAGGGQTAVFEFMSETEMVAALQEQSRFGQVPEELLQEVVDRIRPQLNTKYRERLESVFLSSQQDSSQQQKRSHADFQEQLRVLYNNICLFDAGASVFDDLIAVQLRQHLQRTLCTDAAYMALAYMSGAPSTATMTAKVRDQTIGALETVPARDAFAALFASLASKKDDLEEFYDALEAVSNPSVCALNLKQPDKKMRADLLNDYAKELRRQLSECVDPATGLLLALLVLIAKHSGVGVHASGKFVPNLVDHLRSSSLSNDLKELLGDTQQLVVMSLKKKDDVEQNAQLSAKFEQLKAQVLRESESS